MSWSEIVKKNASCNTSNITENIIEVIENTESLDEKFIDSKSLFELQKGIDFFDTLSDILYECKNKWNWLFNNAHTYILYNIFLKRIDIDKSLDIDNLNDNDSDYSTDYTDLYLK